MVNNVRFMISEEGLASGPGTRLDYSRALVAEFYSSERGQRKLLTQTSGQGEGRAPPSLSKGAIYIFNWLLQ